MITRLLSLALFLATLYYLPRRKSPTPPRRAYTEPTQPPGDGFYQMWVYAPAEDGTLRKVG